jgi:hypothetical protein
MKSMHYTYTKFAVFLGILFAVQFPLVVSAATFSLSPAKVTIHKGESFSVSVGVNGATDVSTVQMNAQFTPGILRFSGWSGNDAWMALKTADADSFSNTSGTLLKTSGFPGGFSGSKNFGRATFVGNEVGEGTVTLSSNSFIYNNANENTFAPGNAVSVTVLPPVVKEPAKGGSVITQPEPSPDTGIDHTFDLALELPKVNLTTGEDLSLSVHVTNLSSKIENMQIPVVYQIFDINGAKVKETTNITQLKTVNTKFVSVLPTRDLAPGSYNLRAEVAFENLTAPAVSQAAFNVENAVESKKENTIPLVILSILMIVLGVVLGANLKKVIKKLPRRK